MPTFFDQAEIPLLRKPVDFHARPVEAGSNTQQLFDSGIKYTNVEDKTLLYLGACESAPKASSELSQSLFHRKVWPWSAFGLRSLYFAPAGSGPFPLSGKLF